MRKEIVITAYNNELKDLLKEVDYLVNNNLDFEITIILVDFNSMDIVMLKSKYPGVIFKQSE